MKTSIFKYNKNNDLIDYLELDNNLELKCCYTVKDNMLKKIYNNVFVEGKKTFKEERRVIISFEEQCALTHMFIDGESWVRAIKKGTRGMHFPKEKSRIETSNECPEVYKVKNSFINDCISLLKN